MQDGAALQKRWSRWSGERAAVMKSVSQDRTIAARPGLSSSVSDESEQHACTPCDGHGIAKMPTCNSQDSVTLRRARNKNIGSPKGADGLPKET